MEKISIPSLGFFLINVGPLWASDIRDVKGPVQLPFETPIFLILGALFIVCFVGFFLYQKIQNQKNKPSFLMQESAWQIASNQLQQLLDGGYLADDQFGEYYLRLSNIVRHYFENQFLIKAPDMTTEEFLASLGSSQKLNHLQKEILKEFLTSCDMVKFAKYMPGRDESKKVLAIAQRLIDETKQVGSSNDI